MGKPLDPDYFKKYRAAHPDYAARDRARRRARKVRSPRGDRSAENARRRRPAVEPMTITDGRFISVIAVLKEDLAQELALAKLERRKNPQQHVDEYRRRESAFLAITCPLIYD